MGTKFVEIGADYSAISLGHAGLYTSVSSGLKILHEIRRSASKAVNNSAPGGPKGTILGSPVFSAASTLVSGGNGIKFGVGPANGSSTFVVTVKVKNTGNTTLNVISGVVSDNPVIYGAAYFSVSDLQVRFDAISFPLGSTPPYSGYSTRSAFTVFPSDSPDGSEELLFAVMESNVSLRMYHPKTSKVITTDAVGRDFLFNTPALFQTSNPGGAAVETALFGYWNRVLTPAEMNTFYAEIKTQYAQIGLVV